MPRGNLLFEELEAGRVFTTRRRMVTETDAVASAGLSGAYGRLRFDIAVVNQRGETALPASERVMVRRGGAAAGAS